MARLLGRGCLKVLNEEVSQLKTMEIFLTTLMLCKEPLIYSSVSQALRFLGKASLLMLD